MKYKFKPGDIVLCPNTEIWYEVYKIALNNDPINHYRGDFYFTRRKTPGINCNTRARWDINEMNRIGILIKPGKYPPEILKTIKKLKQI